MATIVVPKKANNQCSCFQQQCGCVGQSGCNCCQPACGCAPAFETIQVPEQRVYSRSFTVPTRTVPVYASPTKEYTEWIPYNSALVNGHVHSLTPDQKDVNPWDKNQMVLNTPKCRQIIKYTLSEKACIKNRCSRSGKGKLAK